MKLKYPALLAALCASTVQANDLVITGVIDGPLSGGTPKAVEIFVLNDIADLSVCGLGSANNGGGSDGQEYTFNSGPATAGSYIYIASESAGFESYLGFAPTDTAGAMGINGDDAVELFCNGAVVDTFGDINVDGTGEAWDHLDGWAYRTAGTGPDGANFSLASWSFSGTNALDGETSNDTAASVFPLKSYAEETSVGGGGDDGTGEDDTAGACVNCEAADKVADAATFDASSYYATVQEEVDAGSPTDIIKQLLSETISANTTVLTYSQVWTALTATDEDPADSDNIILWYTGTPRAKNLNGGDIGDWNREHSWPSSHGFGDQGFEAYTDIHHLRPADVSVNSIRGNLDFDDSDSEVSAAPGNYVDGDSFEPRDEIKGDVARMMFYMDTRYEGADITPDLQVVDDFTDTSSEQIGRLCRLWEWHLEDPVDASEMARNDAIYEYQGNRNPYIDHSEWAALFYTTDACSSSEDDSDDSSEDDSDSSSSLDSVFISEYIEGSSNNKAIELYNSTGADIDLSASNYQLGRFSNGGTSATLISLEGTLEAGGVFVIANTSSAQDILDVADQTSGSLNHNGDDAYELYADGIVIDSFGQVGTDPGSEWGTAPTDTQNNTLIRNANVYGGDTDSSDEFDPAVEWTGLGQDVFTDLGSHTIEAREIFISEYIEGSSNNKAIELYNPSSSDIDLSAGNYQLGRFSNGGTSATLIDLTGTIPAKGVYVVAHTSSTQEILDVANQTSGSLSHNGDDAYELYSDGVVIDSFGQVGFDPGSQWGTGDQSTQNNTLVRKSTISSGDTISSDEFDPAVEWDGYASDTFTFLGSHGVTDGGDDDDDTVVDPALGLCFEDATLISAVQGSGDVSPLVGETVVIEGIVTASVPGQNAFFVQEENADMDADSSTSEGIFVSYAAELPSVGDVVRVLGVVAENFARTQLAATEAPLICGTDTAQVFSLSLPFTDFSEAEALEGMLVTTAQELIVTDNYTLGQFGQATLSTERLFTPTNVFAPGSEEAIALEASNALNRLLLDDGNDLSNPEVVIFPTGGLSASNTLRGGDTVSSLTGVLDYAFSDYRVIPTIDPTFVATNARTAEPELNLGNLKVASLNVLNYFNNIDSGPDICGPDGNADCRGADSEVEFERQKAKTVAAIVAMDADIVGLMEIENNGFSEGSAIDDLVSAINAIMGEDTYSIVDPGTTVGTDAITVALIYKSSVVSLNGATQILNSDNSISDDDGVLFVDTRNRPAIVQEFALLENNESIVVSVNHLKSKGSSCGTGDDDATTGQGNCNLTRTRAAQALSAFLEEQYPEKATLIIGDLNSYAKEDPIVALEDAGYTNLINYFNGDEAYSYSFDGFVGYLDHALGNEVALEKVVDVTEWHINADEPIALDYNVDFKSDTQIINYYADDAYRMSDHDPVIIALQLEGAAAVTGDWDNDGDVDMDDISGLFRAILSRQSIDLAFDLNNDGVVNSSDIRVQNTLCTRTRCATN
ncbi:ExeM/NucH family extracellular endonuclease [Paraglaciecola sp. 2405UD69-4]|uniref:ExeM/NucH family extracellular endonuclease n=1 Tax=Paraglaciecola sp. 2405UD69-4 TaxID=3391836 RepID=UPI0039C9276C